MMNRTFSSIAVMIALGILTPMQAHAFGLGKLELSSALNEPFKAEIPVTALREDEQGNLQVRLATSSEFARAGIERNFFLTQLDFTVVEKNGSTTIEVTSTQAIKEPFIDFLLTATTGEGRLLREYTVLLDPPKTVFTRPSKIIEPVKTTTAPITRKTTDYQYPDSGGYQTKSVANYFSGNSYGPTKRDDTLWVIAEQTRQSSSISIHQMMIAILDANPNAFINNNINTLKTGQTLTIPSADEIARLSNSQAIARVAEQNRQWKNAANIVTAQSADAAQTESADNQLSSNNTVSEGSDSARLQLVVADDTTSENSDLSPMGSDALTQLKNQLTLAQETIEGQEQETIDFKERMDAMEEQLAIMRRIISVKDTDLARLQGMLGDDQEVELASDDLSTEMQEALKETEIDVTATDELIAETEEMLDEVAIDTTMDEEIAAAEKMLDEEEAMAVDDVMDELAIETETGIDEMFSVAQRMVDEKAVAAAAEAAMAEAEFSGNYVFVAADNMPNALEIDEVAFEELPVDTQLNDDSLQAERMIDEEAVAAAAAAAMAEAEFSGSKIFSDIETAAAEASMPMESMDDELNADPSLEEIEAVVDDAQMDAEPQLALIDKIKAFIADNKMNLLYGLGGLFVALVGWFFIRRRNQDDYEWVENDSSQDIDAADVEVTASVAEENIDIAQDETVDTLAVDEAEEAIASDDTLAVDLTEDTPQESIDDLLNQAEMSIAYGEYEQAHEAVEQARQQDPNSQAVALKLIALAYHQQQAEQFSKLAGEIDIDKESAPWLEIAEWGRDLAPENALFSDGDGSDSDGLSFDLDSSDIADNDADIEALASSVLDNENSDDELIEFNLEDSSLDDVEDEVESVLDTDDEIETLSFDTDFDLENKADDDDGKPLEFDTTLTMDSSEEPALEDFDATVTLDSADELILETDAEEVPELVVDESLDLELPEKDESVSVDSDEEPVQTTTVEDYLAANADSDDVEQLDIGADDLDFDMGDFDEVDEAETKLDLAAAYADMGDPAGARNILEEVIKEGTDDQKSRAQDLLNNLA